MDFPYSRKSRSEADTDNIAKEFSKHVIKGMVISLNGNLGSGKTYFVKRVLEVFDVSNVNSPTFAIVNEYYGKNNFYHIDFYRINYDNELHDIGIEDYFGDGEAVIFIEWGNMFPDILPKQRIEINITMLTDDLRKFDFVKYE
jgi:tRNA threonylcarbamoyladenosine biosynthesis protein TsaE